MVDFLSLIEELEKGLDELQDKYEAPIKEMTQKEKTRRQVLISEVLMSLKHVSHYHALYSNNDHALSIIRLELEPFFKRDKISGNTRIKSIGWRVFLRDETIRVFNSSGIIPTEVEPEKIFIE